MLKEFFMALGIDPQHLTGGFSGGVTTALLTATKQFVPFATYCIVGALTAGFMTTTLAHPIEAMVGVGTLPLSAVAFVVGVGAVPLCRWIYGLVTKKFSQGTTENGGGGNANP